MKEGIHPTYYPEARVVCACGNTWTTGSTEKEIRTEMCSACHPFYTGEQRIVDTEGQVDRFYKRLQARQDFLEEREAREQERVSPDRPLAELELTSRALDALKEAGLTNVGHVLEKLALGEVTLLEVSGFGRKSLADLKKGLRKFGYELPDAAEEIVV
jgi:large subunit ribosomal protein L31